jgi:hypothetical protein
MKQRAKRQRYITAVHEAGHALVGLAAGVGVESVDVNGSVEEGYGGICRFLPWGDGKSYIFDRLTLVTAGSLAEDLFLELEVFGDWQTTRRERPWCELPDGDEYDHHSRRLSRLRRSLFRTWEGKDDLIDFSVFEDAERVFMRGPFRVQPDGVIVDYLVDEFLKERDEPKRPRDAFWQSAQRVILRAERRAEGILKRNWMTVEAVAAALCRRPCRLGGEQLQRVIDSCRPALCRPKSVRNQCFRPPRCRTP